ncbi:hypothetical protein RJ640_011330 [Escallonia rubra]|uniref:TF-B3 domain-containing protein n=1 Tax=Escallonia rubra TaxID=112253 RepID=A0AA88QR26_9ASTE|nr:hypothetical protein RJ640_011330 [Escallonia rubra]
MEEAIGLRLAPEREKLFDKAVTSSDIKLHRFAIPKHEAKKHFALHDASTSKGALLCMEDNEGKVWRFRCKYWKSCQSYVLTSEWNQFVREKGVHVGDMLCFQRSTRVKVQLYIEWKPRENLETASRPKLVQSKLKNVAITNSLEGVREVQTFKLFGVNISQCRHPTPAVTLNTVRNV